VIPILFGLKSPNCSKISSYFEKSLVCYRNPRRKLHLVLLQTISLLEQPGKKNEKKTSETLTKTNLSSASWETKHEKVVLNICFISLKEHILKKIKHINID
jgi:hypothetical protein